jgi:hypothetical protein
VEIRRITVRSQPREEISETAISTNKLVVLVHACNPSYPWGIGRRIVPGKK